MKSTTKKYLIGASTIAAALAVGGTAAFFTSSDMITNIFTTGKTDRDNENAGIDVQEDFRTLTVGGPTYSHPAFGPLGGTNPSRGTNGFEEYDNNTDGMGYGELVSNPTKVLPGELFVKAMRVQSEVNYDQYLRVMPMLEVDGETIVLSDYLVEVSAEAGTHIIYKGLVIELDPSVFTAWTIGTDGYFYYDFILGPGAKTPDIIKSVYINPLVGEDEDPNYWQDREFKVTLKADSIQATTDAWSTVAPNGWAGAGGVALPTLKDLD